MERQGQLQGPPPQPAPPAKEASLLVSLLLHSGGVDLPTAFSWCLQKTCVGISPQNLRHDSWGEPALLAPSLRTVVDEEGPSIRVSPLFPAGLKEKARSKEEPHKD